MTTDPREVNPGSQIDEARINLVIPFDVADYQRLLRACETVSDERGAPYTVHDLICDAVSLGVRDIEAGRPEAGDDA